MRVLERVDIAPLEAVLGRGQEINVVRAMEARRFSRDAICQWCVTHGVYQIPTELLISWLRQEINGRPAIEIGAGNGAIGRALDIPMTDSYMQTRPEIAERLKAIGQTPTSPPDDVHKIDACAAVARYRPEVVLGCWVTQIFDPARGDVVGKAQALMDGVDEEWILDQPYVQKYILVGNIDSHGRKRIMTRPHREKWVTWLVSRAHHQDGNRIWIWERRNEDEKSLSA